VEATGLEPATLFRLGFTLLAGRCSVKVIGYTRVCSDDQEHGIDAQRASFRAAVKRGWEVFWFEDEGKSGNDIDGA